MTGDRSAILARIADEFMEKGRLPLMPGYPGWPDGCRRLMAETHPHEDPREIRFVAEWPGITLIAARSLAGYSLEGGLHRD